MFSVLGKPLSAELASTALEKIIRNAENGKQSGLGVQKIQEDDLINSDVLGLPRLPKTYLNTA